MGVDKIDKERLEEYIKSSTNWKELMKKCGYTNFNNRNPLKKRIVLYNLSINHFINNRLNKRYTDEEIFCKDSKYQSSDGIKKRLIEKYNVLYKCIKCGINEWQGLLLKLELDHINGDHFDNRLDNLRLLCPNCHSQTDTFRGKNVKLSDETIQNNTCKCGNKKYRNASNCIKCSKNIKRVKILQNINTISNIPKFKTNNKCLDCNKIIQDNSDKCIECYKKNRKEQSLLSKTIRKICKSCNKKMRNKTLDICKKCNKENNIIHDVINDMIISIENSQETTLENSIIIPLQTEISKEQHIHNNTKHCIDCNSNIWSNATRCIPCSKLKSRIVERPTYEQLMEDKKTMSMVSIGKKYGVSDNSIRKWIKQYEKEKYSNNLNNFNS